MKKKYLGKMRNWFGKEENRKLLRNIGKEILRWLVKKGI
jgi:hypothetical protein